MGNDKCLICPIQHAERLPVYVIQHVTARQPARMQPHLVRIKLDKSIYAVSQTTMHK